MITLATYTILADAQKDANILSSHGIEVEISQREFTGVIGGNQPSFELQVYKEDIEKLENLQEDIMDKIYNENTYQCPSCGSLRYQIHRAKLTNFLDVVTFIKEQLTLTGFNRYKCKDCDTLFKINL